MAGRKWTNEEDFILKENYQHKSKDYMLSNLDRSWDAIKNRAKLLGVTKKSHIAWNDEDIQFMIENRKKPTRFLCEYLNRTESSINTKRYEMGITYCKDEMLSDSILELKRMYIELGKVPTTDYFDSNRNIGFTRRNIEETMGMKWSDICIKYCGENFRYEYDWDNICNLLLNYYKKNNKPPTFIEFRSIHGALDYVRLKKEFGKTYMEILEYLNISGKHSSTKTWNNDDMLDVLYNKYIELERCPTYDEINDDKNMPSAPYYSKIFGSIGLSLNLRGVPLEDIKLNNWGNMYYDKRGELCRSSVEHLISNFLIDNNISYEKEVGYNILLKNTKDKRRVDWVIHTEDKDIIVEYFGMYEMTKHSKRVIKYRAKTRKKIKDLHRKGLYDDCLFIFPSMMKIKSLEEIFKNVLV